MSDLIKIDIEKIEQALNICLDDVTIENHFHSVNLQSNDENLHRTVEKEHFPSECEDENDLSSIKFVTTLNCCCQQDLFQLSDHCQTILNSLKSNRINDEHLPIELVELYQTTPTLNIEMKSESIQMIRRFIQREEKSRLTSNETMEKLIKFVSEFIRQTLIDQLTRKIEFTGKSFKFKRNSSMKIEETIDEINEKMNKIRIFSNRQLIVEQDENLSIDWTFIVEKMNNQYSVKSCQNLWQQLCYPMLKENRDWTNDEDQHLIDLVQIYGSSADQWQRISSHFPQRSTYMCIHRYMSKENRRQDQLKLTKDQRNMLQMKVEQYRKGNYVPLNKIAYELGLSLSTIRREWRNLDPNIRRGTWKIDEDKCLIQSVLKQINRNKINWNFVSHDVRGRSQTKCYHRYVHLKQNQCQIPFQLTEDLRLIEQHQVQQGRWSHIQLAFPHRSSYSLQNRWRKLIKYRRINELFHNQQIKVQTFLTFQYSNRQSTITNFYEKPLINLNYNQLKSLTSNHFFIEFCETMDSMENLPLVGVRQVLNQISHWTNLEQIHQWFSSFNKRSKTKSRT